MLNYLRICQYCLLPVETNNEPLGDYLESLGYTKKGDPMHGHCFWHMAQEKGWLDRDE